MADRTFRIGNGRPGILTVMQKQREEPHIYPQQGDIIDNTLNLNYCHPSHP